MLAYKSDTKLKTLLLKEVQRHRKADQIIQGTYGGGRGNWKGCAVGCSIHSINVKLGKQYDTNNHSVYEIELGIPETIAHLEDRIFEGLPKEKAVLWPERFLKAIKPGSDLLLVTPKFMVWMLDDLKQYTKDYFDVLKSLETVSSLYQRIIDGGSVMDAEWNAAADAAYAAASAVYAAYAADAAAYAADAAARAARVASEARAAARAVSAADAAARAARVASEARAAADAAYEKMANKLIELLKAV